MRNIFTSTFISVTLVVFSFYGFGQCTGSTFTAGAIYDFSGSAQGFTSTDFTYANNKLNSTTVSAGTTKVLTTAVLLQPSYQSTISWGFDLSGSANVIGYIVEAIYYQNGYQTVTVCSAPGSSIIPGTRNFTATAPAQIVGAQFELKFTFLISGGAGVNITIDNFRTTASTGNSPLPIRFSTFEAKVLNNSVMLSWHVGAEENINGYQVEKSTDGHYFNTIGFVVAKGIESYSFVDVEASTAGYYRIKSTSADGKYNYSPVTTVKSGRAAIVLKAFPIPSTKNVTIQHGIATAGSLLTICSEDGAIIKSILPAIGTQQTEVDLSFAKAGLYLVRYINNNGQAETIKIIKQ